MATSRLTRQTFLRNLSSVTAVVAVGALPRLRAAPAAEGVTRKRAQYLVTARADEIPAAVKKEAARTLLNFAGVALGGARHESVDAALAATGPFSGPAHAQVLGRRERLGIEAPR